MAKYLIAQGTKIGETKYNFQYCPEDVERYLVEQGAKIGDYAVLDAAKTGNLDLLKYLVAHGAHLAPLYLCLDVYEYCKNDDETSCPPPFENYEAIAGYLRSQMPQK